MEHIKVILPGDGAEGCESVFVLVDEDVKRAYDADKVGTTYKGILDDFSILYPELKPGTEIPFTIRGEFKPEVPFSWLRDNYRKSKKIHRTGSMTRAGR